jgi:hypothetical protein
MDTIMKARRRLFRQNIQLSTILIAMKKALRKKNLLYIVLGFLVASTGYLFMEYRYEQKTQQAIINSIYTEKGLNRHDEKQLVLAAMKRTHEMMRVRETGAMNLELSAFEKAFTSPIQTFALTRDGACGGNTLVLAQILKGMGFEVRPAQMLVDGKYGGHIVLEVKVNNHWAVLDPMFNLSFTRPDGVLASFSEVGQNWGFYSLQTPVNYDAAFRFEGVRYTNWDKLPLLGGLAKASVKLFLGKERAESFSVRSLFLNPKKILFFFSLFILGFSLISLLNRKYFHISIPRLLLPRTKAPKPVLNVQ